MKLSGLSAEEASMFKETWARLSNSRKCEVLGELADLSEENLELDFDAVFRASLADGSDDVRERATKGLWECDDRSIIRPLLDLLRNDPSPKVRAAAAVSIAKFADMAQDGKLLQRDGERMKQALVDVIDAEADVDVRRRAIEAVASFNTPDIEQIIRDAYESSDARLKQSAIYAMGRSSDPRWLSIVMEEMRHDDSSIRYEAAGACAQLGDESVVPQLIGLIKDDDFQVQVSAVEALGTLGGPLAKRALLQCLKMEDEALEEAAQTALKELEFDEDPLGFRFQV